MFADERERQTDRHTETIRDRERQRGKEIGRDRERYIVEKERLIRIQSKLTNKTGLRKENSKRSNIFRFYNYSDHYVLVHVHAGCEYEILHHRLNGHHAKYSPRALRARTVLARDLNLLNKSRIHNSA